MKKWQCILVWGQMKPKYPQLSGLLIKVYRSPASTSGVERNHKFGKRFLIQTRARLAEIIFQEQVAITHNNVQLRRPIGTSRRHCVQDMILELSERLKSQSSQELTTPTVCTFPEANMETVDDDESDVLQ